MAAISRHRHQIATGAQIRARDLALRGEVIGTCADCGNVMIPGVDEEADTPRAIGADGKARYFCYASDDALHHAR